MKSISIDIETYSSTNLQKSGVYRYAESDDFEILLFGYSVDGSDVKVIDLCMGEKIPEDILDALPILRLSNGHSTHNLRGYAYQGILKI